MRANESFFRMADEEVDALRALVAARTAERRQSGAITDEEIAHVAALVPRRFDADLDVSEAFRACCVSWEIGRPVPITSHRPWLGLVLVPLKRFVRRLFRFQLETPLARQSEFNRHLLVVLADLHQRDRP